MTAAANHAAEIEALIDEFQRSELRELHVRSEAFELYLSNDADAGLDVRRWAGAPPPAATPSTPAAAAAAAKPAAALPPGTTAVSAPYLGTFYRAPKPGAAAYVEIGARVQPEDELCLVEVMKLFTSVRAGVAGTIEAVLANDGQMVEAGQPLFAIRGD